MKLDKYIPKIYKKSIFDINYKLLKENGIKCILFDLDNTLVTIDTKISSKEVINLLKSIKKDFKIIVLSNNFRGRINPICKNLDVEFVSFALKPLSLGFKRVQRKYGFEKQEMCIVGDQLMSDILGGNIYGITTILVDPLSNHDLKITKINRLMEKKIFKSLTDRCILERGKYYESR